MKWILLVFIFLIPSAGYTQEGLLTNFLSDSIMDHASLSVCIRDVDDSKTILEYNSRENLIPASVMKLVTSAAALEMLGPGYRFTTRTGYTGQLNRRTGRLSGDIVLAGGGDPVLGSRYFKDHYGNFLNKWVAEIRSAGIRKINGNVIADDSYYDYLPVPAKWQWEDIGNYYGAGVYGLSVYDNTFEIHMKTTSASQPIAITYAVPAEYGIKLTNRLKASGNSDEGYIFSAPYSDYGWMEGTVPENTEDFILKGSITDPPLLIAGQLEQELSASGMKISGNATTARIENEQPVKDFTSVSVITSPPLSEIIKVLNHESVNLIAETLIKELGKKFRNEGSTSSGTEVVKEFLKNAGIDTRGIFIEDGSGLSTLNGLNSEMLVMLLTYMKKSGAHFNDFISSLPEAGKNGTLRYCFRDSVFMDNLRAKSGSMTRVRCYSGYFTTVSGKYMAFSFMVNNFSGNSGEIISWIEDIIADIILHK